MTEPYQQHLSSRRQLFYLFSLWFGFIIIGAAVSLGFIALVYGRQMATDVLKVNHTDQPGFLTAFRIFIGLGNTLAQFFVVALIFTYAVVRDPEEYLRSRNYFKPILLLIAG